jgi:hypothetical protein
MRTTLRVERLDRRDTPAVLPNPLLAANPLFAAVAQEQAVLHATLVQQAVVQAATLQPALAHTAVVTPMPAVVPPTPAVVMPAPVTPGAITLSTPTGSLALPAQPFLLTRPFPGAPQVFALTTGGGSLTVTGPFVFTSPLFSFSVG